MGSRLALATLLLGLVPLTGMVVGPDAARTPPTSPLAPCPRSPNCVSTEATDAEHAMPPVPFTDAPDRALARARAALLAEPRTRIVEERGDYLHAESRSRVFRFVDDVEVVVDAEARLFRFRSASRVGRRDFGVNRARMERVSARLRGAASV
ncbi:MAG: DUF1499 domain-containing protein [Gemmatirosa sp.]